MDTAQTNASNNNVDLSGLLNSLPSSVGSMLKAGGNVAQKKADIDVQSQDALAQKTTPINQAYEQQIQKQGATQEKIAGQLGQPFQVPQETVSDYGQLGGIVAMLGVMLGKSGKQSATNVLAAIDGTLKGYQQGRKDMIATAQKEFDTNMKRLQAEAQNAAAMLENATKLRAVNLDKANQEVAQLKAHALQGIASSDYIVQNADKAMQLAVSLKNSATNAGQLALQVQKLNNEIVAQDPQGLYTRNPKTGELQLVPGSAGKQKFGAPIVDPNKASAAGARDRFGYGNIVAVNLNEAVGSINNIVNLPFKVTTGAFQGRNTSGLLDAPLGALTNNLTKEDVQRYNVEISNFGKFAARVVSGGRVVPASVQQGFEEQYKIREGDKPLTVLTKMAMMRQTLERAAQVYLADPNTAEGTKEIYRQGLIDIKESIPFTVNEVNKFANSRDNKTTFSQVFPQYGLSAQQPSSSQPSTSSATKTMPTDERLNAYVAAHPEFGGDINKAKEFLRTQGYK